MEKHIAYLKAIEACHCHLQTKCCALEDRQEACDVLAKCVMEGNHKPGDDYYYCKLKSDKFEVGNFYDTEDDFISGVTKIQREKVLKRQHNP